MLPVTGIDEGNWVGIGAPNLVSIALPLRRGTKCALGFIMVVDCKKSSCCFGFGEEGSSLIEKRKLGAGLGTNLYRK